MSYVSVLKNIPELLSQPAGIAAIASVGIHGAIAFILPLMPVDSKPKQKTSPASVGIMELSQAEQNRLPQKKGPQIPGLPQVSLQPGLPLPNFAKGNTPLGKLPIGPNSTKVILPPLPNSSVNPSISSLPKNQSLPILPQPNFNPSFNAKANNRGSYRNYNPKIQLGKQASLSSRRSTSSRSSLPQISPLQSAPLPPELTGIPTPPPLPPTANSGMGLDSNNSVAINPQINPDFSNRVPVNQPRRVSPEEFIAPTNRSIPKPGDNLTLAGQSFQQWGNQPSGRKINLPNQPLNNGNTIKSPQNSKIAPQNTTTLALAKQFEEVKGLYPNLETKEPISDVVKTKPGKEGKVEGTIVIDSDGKPDYLKYVDRTIPDGLKEATRNYFRNYSKKNPIRKNGKAQVYAFTLDFKSKLDNGVEFSQPESKLSDRLRSTKDRETQPNKKPEDLSRNSAPVKIDVQPSPGTVVIPTEASAPARVKPPLEIRTKKPASTSETNNKPAVELRLRNNQQLPNVPAKPKPQARVNVDQTLPQSSSKPSSLANRLKDGRNESENNSQKNAGSKNKLIQQLRKIQEQRENSN